MNSSIILQQLLDIERSIGVETDSTVRRKVMDAQECLLRMEGEVLRQLTVPVESGDWESQALMRALRNVSEDQA